MRACENCKLSEPVMGGLACMGQKGMPFVRPTDSCDNWKTMKQTNYDRIRAMTDEELAEYLSHIDSPYRMGYARKDKGDWLYWLKQEVET